MFTWVGQYAPLELFWLWTRVHLISFPQRRRGCGWSSFFRCSICRSILEIFAVEVESCQKSRRNLDVFWPSQILGRAFQKLYSHYHPSLAARDLEKFREGTHTSREVIRANTLNFGPNFKIWGGSSPFKGRNVVSRKCLLGWVSMHL